MIISCHLKTLTSGGLATKYPWKCIDYNVQTLLDLPVPIENSTSNQINRCEVWDAAIQQTIARTREGL